jgi:hypothetical protein
MDLERTDEAVVNGSGDSLRWLAHPNVAPVVPVAAQPLPFGLSGEVPVAPKVAAPGPEAQLLLGKAADKLERWGASEPAPAPGTPVSGQGTALSREEIETRALLAVAKQREAEDDAGHLAERVPAESRLAPLGLLAGITEATAEVGPEEGAANNPRAGRRELRGLLEVDLQLIDLLPPARELKPALERVRPLVLLQPDSLASRP